MPLTNRFNLPLPLVRAVERDDYSKGDADFSVTEIINPPQISGLMRKHRDEIEEDASDRIWALLGKAVHYIIEMAARDMGHQVQSERRLNMNVGNHSVSGQLDLLEDNKLWDFKVTSAWTILFGSRIDEWTQQVNMYVQLARHHDIEVESAEVVAILRDWSKTQAVRSSDYPQVNVARFPISIWPDEYTLDFMQSRVDLHAKAADGQWPRCTDDERWHQPDKWAVMKRGRKTAVKLHDIEYNALKHAMNQGGAHYVEHRPGKDSRCEDYCPVSKFCSQFQEGGR